jgi:phage-related minor tail protein
LTIIRIFKRGAEGIEVFASETIRQLNRVIAFSNDVGEALGWAKKIEPIKDSDLGLVDVFEDLERKIEALGIASDRANDANNDFNKGSEDLGETLEKVLMTMNDVRMNGINALEDALVSIIDRTSSVKDAFKSMARSIISDLVRMQIQQSITGPLAQAMGFQVSGLKAIGGPVQSGSAYVVGERGPEMFVPNSSGAIVPNDRMSAGGVIVNQTINVSTGVQQTVRAEVMQMMPQISNAAKSAVLDARRRGGSFAAAF